MFQVPINSQQLHPEDFGPHWNTNYYEILQDYYFEPQHIDRGKVENPRFQNEKQVLWHIRKMEVSLNHLLALFFSLAPRDFIHQIEAAAFGGHTAAIYRQVSLFELRLASPHDPTQPDVFLVSADRCLSIEVKINAKSKLEQVAKYALLHIDFAKRNGIPANGSRLIYLTPRSVSKTWEEKYPDIATMRTALDAFDFAGLLAKAEMSAGHSPEELKAAALAMPVAHITFGQLNEFTKAYADSIPLEAPYADTARKLFDGLLHELEFRSDLLGFGDRSKNRSKTPSQSSGGGASYSSL